MGQNDSSQPKASKAKTTIDPKSESLATHSLTMRSAAHNLLDKVVGKHADSAVKLALPPAIVFELLVEDVDNFAHLQWQFVGLRGRVVVNDTGSCDYC
jgi:hypothetical protein